METQINTAWFDSAWPKVLMETPRKTRSHCLLTKRTVWHFLAGFSCWFYLSISRHLKPFGSKFRLKNQHTAYIVHRDIVVKMIGQWEWYPLGLSHAVFLSLLGHKALFSFSPYLSQTDWGHIAIILFVNKWVDLFFLSLSRDVHTNTQWVTFTLLCPAGFFFSWCLDYTTKNPLLCLVATSLRLSLTCNMIRISIRQPGQLLPSEPTGLRAEISSLRNECSASVGQEKERPALSCCSVTVGINTGHMQAFMSKSVSVTKNAALWGRVVMGRFVRWWYLYILHLPFTPPAAQHPPSSFIVLTPSETGKGFTLCGGARRRERLIAKEQRSKQRSVMVEQKWTSEGMNVNVGEANLLNETADGPRRRRGSADCISTNYSLHVVLLLAQI